MTNGFRFAASMVIFGFSISTAFGQVQKQDLLVIMPTAGASSSSSPAVSLPPSPSASAKTANANAEPETELSEPLTLEEEMAEMRHTVRQLRTWLGRRTPAPRLTVDDAKKLNDYSQRSSAESYSNLWRLVYELGMRDTRVMFKRVAATNAMTAAAENPTLNHARSEMKRLEGLKSALNRDITRIRAANPKDPQLATLTENLVQASRDYNLYAASIRDSELRLARTRTQQELKNEERGRANIFALLENQLKKVANDTGPHDALEDLEYRISYLSHALAEREAQLAKSRSEQDPAAVVAALAAGTAGSGGSASCLTGLDSKPLAEAAIPTADGSASAGGTGSATPPAGPPTAASNSSTGDSLQSDASGSTANAGAPAAEMAAPPSIIQLNRPQSR